MPSKSNHKLDLFHLAQNFQITMLFLLFDILPQWINHFSLLIARYRLTQAVSNLFSLTTEYPPNVKQDVKLYKIQELNYYRFLATARIYIFLLTIYLFYVDATINPTVRLMFRPPPSQTLAQKLTNMSKLTFVVSLIVSLYINLH